MKPATRKSASNTPYRHIERRADGVPVFKGTDIMVGDVIGGVFFPELVTPEDVQEWIDAGITNAMVREALEAHEDLRGSYTPTQTPHPPAKTT